MDNMTGAIKMAGGILIAILLASLVMWMYDRMKVYPELQAQQKKEEEITEFNNQFKAYEKSQMYGTDVISCLNLAFEFNATNRNYYSRATSFISRNSEGINENSIEVEVRLKKALNAEVVLYKFYENLGREEIVGSADNTLKSNQTLKEVFDENKLDKNLLKNIISTFDSIRESDEIDKLSRTGITKLDNIIINNNETTSQKNYNNVRSLIEKTEVVATNKKYNYNDNNWSKLVIRTPGNDLKKRAFKWVNTEYDKDGRIKKIIFEDLSKN